ncbi:hypothetical protein C8R41DRAFT_919466 [Lentinula lateritia]|uniref:Uncharacterized protein n=1 Tax=Lentinula lateritia TaxID=40482 RepID=A0ABQ8VH21_9AGAR|nr:hypothetical protein C8R41DRAFT_919466 [Lentinula lateritia]
MFDHVLQLTRAWALSHPSHLCLELNNINIGNLSTHARLSAHGLYPYFDLFLVTVNPYQSLLLCSDAFAPHPNAPQTEPKPDSSFPRQKGPLNSLPEEKTKVVILGSNGEGSKDEREEGRTALSSHHPSHSLSTVETTETVDTVGTRMSSVFTHGTGISLNGSDGQVHEVYDEYGRGSSSLPASQMVAGGITAPGIIGSDGDDELGLQDAFSRPQRSIRLEIRFQGPQSPDAYGVPASQIIQSGQGKSAKRLKLTDIELLELARQLTLLESALYQKIRPMEYLQCAREGVGTKDKDGGSGGGMDKESVNK